MTILARNSAIQPTIFLVSVVMPSAIYAAESDRDRFLSEYPSAFEKIEQLYKGLEISGVAEFGGEDQDPNMTGARYNYIANNGQIRIDRNYIGNDSSFDSHVWNDEMHFVVDKNEDTSDQLPFRLRKSSGPSTPREQAAQMFPPAYVPYSVDVDTVANLLNKRGFQILEVRKEGEGVDEQLVVSWKWDWEGEPLPSRAGEMTFWPGGVWVLKNYHWRQRMPDGTWLPHETFCDIEYNGEIDEIALVSRIKKGLRYIDSGKFKDLWTFEVSSIGQSNARNDRFSLAEFGLGHAKSTRWPIIAWWLISVGLLGFIILHIIRSKTAPQKS